VVLRFTNYGGNPTASGIEIKNNLFVNVGANNANNPVLFVQESTGFTPSSWSFDANVYAQPSGQQYIVFRNTTYTAAQWVAAQEPTGTVGVPTFVAYTPFAPGNDFHLAAGDTVAANTGLSFASLFTTDKDAVTRPQGSAWDRGPYERVAAAGSPLATITAPTATPTFTTASTPLTTLAGTATDDIGVTSVTWTNDRGGSGVATCASCGPSALSVTWSVPSIALQPGANVLVVTAHDGNALLGSDTLTLTYQPAGPPTVTINAPTSSPNMTTATTPLTTLAGTAADDVGVTSVTWTNDRGGSGVATCGACGASGASVTWSVPSIALQPGANVLVVTAQDAGTLVGSDTLTVTYQPQAAGTVPTQLVNGNMVLAGHLNSCLDMGVTNAYACPLDRAITAYFPRTCYAFLATSSNTGPPTLNVSGLGPIPIKKFQSGVLVDLAAGEIVTGQIVHVCYDGSVMQRQ
jgi:hypothetical protein